MAPGSNSRRGWVGFAFTWSIGASVTLPSAGMAGGAGVATTAGVGRAGRSEWSPLPSALRGSFLLIGEDLFRELDIGFRTPGAGIVGQNGFSVAGGFGEANIARD